MLVGVPDVLAPDRSALRPLRDSDQPLLAGVANCLACYLDEQRGDLTGAVRAGERMLAAFEDPPIPWMQVMAHSRISELCLLVDRGDQALQHLKVALEVQEQLGERFDLLGIQLGLALASLQCGAIDEAEHWLELAARTPVDDDVSTTYELGVRAEILLARGEVDTVLRQWRHAVDRLRSFQSPIFGIGDGMDPWVLEVEAVAVIAHARNGRLDLVGQTAAGLPRRLSTMLTNPVAMPPPYLMEFPICGALLLAVAVVELDNGARTGDDRATGSAARMIALAERFHFVRNFQPTMSPAQVRQLGEQADRSGCRRPTRVRGRRRTAAGRGRPGCGA